MNVRVLKIARIVREFFIGFWWATLNFGIGLGQKFRGFWQNRAIRKISCDFCAEVAVLVAVFPVLDFILGGSMHRGNAGAGALTFWGVARVSALITASALLAAFILSAREG